MQKFIENLQQKTVVTLQDMYFYAKGYEKDLIEAALIKKIYSK